MCRWHAPGRERPRARRSEEVFEWVGVRCADGCGRRVGAWMGAGASWLVAHRGGAAYRGRPRAPRARMLAGVGVLGPAGLGRAHPASDGAGPDEEDPDLGRMDRARSVRDGLGPADRFRRGLGEGRPVRPGRGTVHAVQTGPRTRRPGLAPAVPTARPQGIGAPDPAIRAGRAPHPGPGRVGVYRARLGRRPHGPSQPAQAHRAPTPPRPP